VKSLTCLKSAAAAAALLGALVHPASAAGVSFNLSVTNVVREDCTGLLQSTCTFTNVAGFVETLTIDPTTLTASSPGPGTSSATYDFPIASAGNPYTAGLQSILTQAPTLTTAFSQFDNSFGGGSGVASAQIYADQTYDDGSGSTGEFSQNYSLLGLLASLSDFNDLSTTSLSNFLSPLLGQMSGSYYAFGSDSTLNAASGVFSHYAFTSYTGDVALMPEPATLALVAGALAAAGLGRRRARSQVERA